jgi:hypothetical protein
MTMNQQLTVLTAAIVLALLLQTYMVFKLTAVVAYLGSQHDQADSAAMGTARLPTLIPSNPGCGLDSYDSRRESF